MLEAVRSRSFDKLFYRYNFHYLIRWHFHDFGVAGELQPPSIDDRPLLYIMNHSSWWDGLLAYHAARTLTNREHYFMMEEEQLRKYTFFRKLGAYSINRHSTVDIGTSLRYTTRLLRAGGSVWMYPEGEIQPLEHRPIVLKEGAGVVLRLCPEAVVVPVTLYHGLFRHSKPEATLLAGVPLTHSWKDMDRNHIGKELQTVLGEQLNNHRQMIINHGGYMPEQFHPLMKQGRSTNEWFDAVLAGEDDDSAAADHQRLSAASTAVCAMEHFPAAEAWSGRAGNVLHFRDASYERRSSAIVRADSSP